MKRLAILLLIFLPACATFPRSEPVFYSDSVSLFVSLIEENPLLVDRITEFSKDTDQNLWDLKFGQLTLNYFQIRMDSIRFILHLELRSAIEARLARDHEQY